MLSKNHVQITVILTAGFMMGIVVSTIFLNSEIGDLNDELGCMSSLIEVQDTTISFLREELATLENQVEEERPWWLYYGDVTPEQALRMLEGDDPPGVIDVRFESEYNESRIGGAVNIPINELSERVDELNQSQEYIVYCKSGYRSRQALVILGNFGVNKTFNIAGGIDNWSNEGLSVIKKCPCEDQ